jgi:hypothetical protein
MLLTSPFAGETHKARESKLNGPLACTTCVGVRRSMPVTFLCHRKAANAANKTSTQKQRQQHKTLNDGARTATVNEARRKTTEKGRETDERTHRILPLL